MKEVSAKRPIVEMAEAFSDLIDQGARVGMDLLESLSPSRMPLTMGGTLRDLMRRLPRMPSCSCAIPPPCWAPQPLDDVASHVCPGGTATIRIRVTNCGTTSRDVELQLAGTLTGITVTPSSLSLGPMERGFAVASGTLPADSAIGQEFEMLLWVRGCQDHYLRWTVKVARRGTDCCHEVDVDDCPDLIHHWYDHFYCERPCVHGGD